MSVIVANRSESKTEYLKTAFINYLNEFNYKDRWGKCIN